MKISKLIVSQHHPWMIACGCLVGMALIIAFVAFEARRRHNQRKQRKKYEHTCFYCRTGEVVRRHIRTPLSPDPTGDLLTKFLSRMDYLCQTQATCRNPKCPHKCMADDRLLGLKKGDNMPYAEKTEVKQWGLRSRLTRFRQLRQTVTADQLIPNSYVTQVLRERGLKPKVARPPTTEFKKQIVLPPGVIDSLGGVNLKK